MYDFDTPIDRHNTNSLKWDLKENVLPMWVADMDFQTAPEIIEELQKRVAHGVFGYSLIPEEWADAYIGWWERRHHFKMEKDWLVFCTGVIPALSSCVRKLTTPAENVVVMSPVYNHFYSGILNNGRNVVESRLLYEDGSYSIDFADLEEKLADPQSTLMILCNPHNPIGKIWDKETLEKIGNLCAKHHVVVISDEIHCDLTVPGTEYIPFASVSDVCRDNSITCIAPTKCFNMAGLQTAAVSIPNPQLRHKVWRALNTDEVAEPSAFAVQAAVAAFTKGENWLNELNAYLAKNREIVKNYLADQLPELTLVPGSATYLLWIDCRNVTEDSRDFTGYLRRHNGLFLNAGKEYRGDGSYFVRLNTACPASLLQDGLNRLKEGTESYRMTHK
jgi:cystathionine beta-lyase